MIRGHETAARNFAPAVRRGRVAISIACIAAALSLAGCSRSSSPAAAARPQLRALEFAGAWGIRGADPGQLDTPIGVAADAIGRIYIADTGTSSIEKFTAVGGPLLSFGDASVAKAAGIAVDRGGGIYVAEGDRVQIFWPEGDQLRLTRGGFAGATGVAVDSDGTYYATDRLLCRVVQFDNRGRLMRTWGRRGTGDGEFTAPSGIAIGPDGFIYTADSGGSRIQKFSRDGVWVSSIGQADATGGALANQDAVGIAVSARAIFVVGSAGAALRVWSLDGHEIPIDPADLSAADLPSSSQSAAQPAPELRLIAVALDPPSGDLLLLDAASDRVLRFHVHI